MDKKEIIKVIEEKFANMMTKYGFYVKFSNTRLKRKTEYGSDSIHFIYKNYDDSIELLVDIGVRYDKVMNYMSTILEEPGYWKNDKNNTLLGLYLHVFKGKITDLEIKTLHDVDSVLKEVYADIVKYALPFFNKYSDIMEVYKLSLDDRKPLSLMPLDNYRAIKSITISKLYNIGNTKELIEDRRKYLNGMKIDGPQKDLMLTVFEYFVSKVEEDL